MEYRSQKTAVRLVAVALVLAGVSVAQELRFNVRHERALRDHPGVVTFDDTGVTYQQVMTDKQQAKVAKGKKPPEMESARWAYEDIQQLWIAPDKLVILTYHDRKWLLGVDREFEFYRTTGSAEPPFTAAYERLKDRLDQRLVAALADDAAITGEPLWQIPVKLQGAIQGSEGMLVVGKDHLLYKTDRKGESRTWRLEDIENVSSAGPFELTLVTYERAKAQYGSRRNFQFQLKRRLNEHQLDQLWKRLNRHKGLEFLSAMER